MIKRKLSALLLSSMMLLQGLGVQAAFYSDVPASAWYKPYADRVSELGIMNGSNGRFNPDQIVSRGMMAQTIYNYLGKPDFYSGAAPGYTDLKGNAYYNRAAAYLYWYDLMTGYSDGRFGGEDPLTREQFALLLFRLAKYKGYDTSSGSISRFPDAGAVATYAKEAMGWAVNHGLIGSNGKLNPAGRTTRAEAAKMWTEFYNYSHGLAPTPTPSTGTINGDWKLVSGQAYGKQENCYIIALHIENGRNVTVTERNARTGKTSTFTAGILYKSENAYGDDVLSFFDYHGAHCLPPISWSGNTLKVAGADFTRA